MSVYVVVRRSVDWLGFEPQDSGPFLRSQGLPDSLIVEFCRLWRRTMRLSFQEVRAELAAIARRSWTSVPGAVILTPEALQATRLEDRDRVLFTDDDDWFSPAVCDLASDAVWGSVAIVRIVWPPERARDPVLLRRPGGGPVYTNNASLSGATLRRLGLAAVFEHGGVEHARRGGEFQPALSPQYLSCAIKHPCCTTAISLNSRAEQFEDRLEGLVRAYVDGLKGEDARDIAWSQPYRDALADVFERCLGR